MFVLQFFKRIRMINTTRRLLLLLLFVAVATVAYAVTFKIYEDSTWDVAFWMAWEVLTTVGFGDYPPQSGAGRLATVFIGTIGIAFVGTLISAIFDYREQIRTLRRFGMHHNTHNNGYLILNFPGSHTLKTFISQRQAVEKNPKFCIVDNRIEELPPEIAAMDSVNFVKGSLINPATYGREGAQAKDQKIILVYPKDNDDPDSDGQTKLVVEIVLGIIDQSKTRVIHFLVSPSNDFMFENLNSTSVMMDSEILLASQEVDDPHTSQIVTRLVSNTEGANPMTVQPKKILGWTWGNVMKYSIQTANVMGLNVNLFAHIHNGETNCCPDYDTLIKEGDELSIIIIDPSFDWDGFEEALVDAKKAEDEI